MPKRPRQAHIPSQQVRRRKPRRTQDFSSSLAPQGEAVDVASEEAVEAVAVSPRVGRRAAALTRAREGGVSRSAAGQLPTFDRAYLTRELTQIGLVTGALVLVLLVLWLVMR